jgi:phenol 2-monooxygenase
MPNILLENYTLNNRKLDSIIEILIIHVAPREYINLLDIHPVYHLFDDDLGWDYDKVYIDGASYQEGESR